MELEVPCSVKYNTQKDKYCMFFPHVQNPYLNTKRIINTNKRSILEREQEECGKGKRR
jgi:hypothetical protein